MPRVIGIHVTNFGSGMGATAHGEYRDASTLEATTIIEEITGQKMQKGRRLFRYVSGVTPEHEEKVLAAFEPKILQYIWIGNSEDKMYQLEMTPE